MSNQLNPEVSTRQSLKFNPTLIPLTDTAKDYVNALAVLSDETEMRKRKRKLNDQIIHEKQLSSLGCALAILILEGRGSALFYQRSKRILGTTCRYKHSFITESLNALIDTLEQAGLLTKITGRRGKDARHGIATLIEPTEYLRDVVASSGVSLQDFGRGPPPELVVLRDTKSSDFDSAGKAIRGPLIDYEDSPQTVLIREQVAEVNAWIATAELGFDIRHANRQHVDTSDICLRRHFSGGSLAFDQCGRLYGGFWQGLTKEQRKAGLTINDQPTVTLDYGEMNLRLAYGYAKVVPPKGDLYAIPGLETVTRSVVKKLVNSLFYLTSPRTRKPPELIRLLPAWLSIAKLTKAVTDYHWSIAHLFHSGIGLRLMYMESEVLRAVLSRLKCEGIVALPIHDAVIVERGHASKVRQIMDDVFYQIVGIRAEVKQEE